MLVFVLFIYGETAEPTWAYVDPAICNEAASELREHYSIMADCRAAKINTPVKALSGNAPWKSPRPKAKPGG